MNCNRARDVRIRSGFTIAAVCVAALVLGGQARAASLVEVDRQRHQETSPPTGQQDGGCDSFGSASAEGGDDGRSGFARVETLGVIESTDPACMASQNAAATSQASFQIVAGPGESPGDEVIICLNIFYQIGASARGNGMAQATLGGSTFPITTPLSVMRNADVIFSTGPTTVSPGGTFGDRLSRSFSAQVGDLLSLSAGTQTIANIMGVGTARATGEALLEVSIGACPVGAPVTSGAGLGFLAAVLAALGTAVLSSRRARA